MNATMVKYCEELIVSLLEEVSLYEVVFIIKSIWKFRCNKENIKPIKEGRRNNKTSSHTNSLEWNVPA